MLQKPESQSLFRLRLLPWVVIGLALLILGGTIFFGSLSLREKSRQQITGQHAQILYALWQSQKFNDDSESAVNSNERAADQVPAVLQMERLPQLAGAHKRVFDAQGLSLFIDPDVSESTLSASDLAQLRQLKPVAHLRESADLSEISVGVSDNSPRTGPLFYVCIPLHSADRKELLGVGQFILDGTNVVAEFRKLDRNLIWQGTLTFVVGGGLLSLVLALSFRQLQRMNRLLSERTRSLLKANQELTLAAKTSAVGAVTAHLIHGLKNPLSGLQNFVAARGLGSEEGTESDWQLAVASTRRMQSMIGEIVRVLRDEQGDGQYEMSLGEFTEMLEAKVRPLAREAGVQFTSQLAAEGTLRNREANLISLVLYNLIQNAIQATPPGKSVHLSFVARDEQIVCEVRDQGAGIGQGQLGELFKPCRSSKEGGSGIGLAISKQLANCIGADLDLKETSLSGSVFVLTFHTTSADGDQVLAAENALR